MQWVLMSLVITGLNSTVVGTKQLGYYETKVECETVKYELTKSIGPGRFICSIAKEEPKK